MTTQTMPEAGHPTRGLDGVPLLSGIRTVATLELRQRVRSSRWVVVLVIWFAVLSLLTMLVRWSVQRAYQVNDVVTSGTVPNTAVLSPDAVEQARRSAEVGRIIFAIIVFLVLSLGMLIAPALSATSVNGDRNAGVLATLQTTLLTPVQIVLGKLVAAWAVALALLVTALPLIGWAYFDGGTALGRLLVVLALLAATLLVVCAVGLGWSAIVARTSTSAVLTYLTVALLGPGLPLLFLLSLSLVSQDDLVVTRQPVSTESSSADPSAIPSPSAVATPDNTTYQCETVTQRQTQYHTERSWWLLAASPFVIVADAAPSPGIGDNGSDPLSTIRYGVREARLGPSSTQNWCDAGQVTSAEDLKRQAQRDSLGITWPYGLAADLVLGGGFTLLAVRRLRAPSRVLPRGTRVA